MVHIMKPSGLFSLVVLIHKCPGKEVTTCTRPLVVGSLAWRFPALAPLTHTKYNQVEGSLSAV